MSIVRSFTVGQGDMFYIDHNSNNFTIIDCQLFGEHKDWLTAEIKKLSGRPNHVTRFISTHPDEDHIEGLEHLDEEITIRNFYVVKNAATKPEPSTSFKHYCGLRDGDRAYHVYKGCKRKWMNQGDDERGPAGIHILWPDTSNQQYKAALQDAADGIAFNNISLVARYAVESSASFMWIGDLETQFMEDIIDDIDLSETTVVFAPHHGRKSGKLPDSWLAKLKPKIVIIGEAESRHLHYYSGYNKITQTKAWDITFAAKIGKLHCYASNPNYELRDWLDDEGLPDEEFGERDTDHYIGTLNL